MIERGCERTDKQAAVPLIDIGEINKDRKVATVQAAIDRFKVAAICGGKFQSILKEALSTTVQVHAVASCDGDVNLRVHPSIAIQHCTATN